MSTELPPYAQPNAIIAGRYRVERLLGEGGIGIVAEATALESGRRVAIKLLKPAFASDAEWVARFAREARAATAIRGKHVASVLDVGEVSSGNPFIVMELLQGSDLDGVLTARGPLPIAEAVGYILQACEALAEAHARGIVHRDLKPANLFLEAGVIKVLDFGISKMQDDAQKLTRTSATMGSLLYMSPEQLRNSKSVDHRADIYSLGVTFYELLTGRGPFIAETSALLCVAILTTEPTPLRDLRPDAPPALAEVVHRALRSTPEERTQTIADLARDLRPFTGHVDELGRTGVAHVPAARGRHATFAPVTGTSTRIGKLGWVLGVGAGSLAIVAGVLALRPAAPAPRPAVVAATAAEPSATASAISQATADLRVVAPTFAPTSASAVEPSAMPVTSKPRVVAAMPPHASTASATAPPTATPPRSADPFGGGRK